MESLGGGPNTLLNGSYFLPNSSITANSNIYTISCDSASPYISPPLITQSRGSLSKMFLPSTSKSTCTSTSSTTPLDLATYVSVNCNYSGWIRTAQPPFLIQLSWH